MDFKQLGSTGLRISRLILGCGNFGGVGSDPRFAGKGDDETHARALMDDAVEIGINLFDTADAYGGGESEAIIGRWLKTKSAGVRDQVLLSTKIFNPVGDGPNDWGLSRRHIKRQVDRSLSRLGVDRLDLLLVHEPDRTTPIEESLAALDELVRIGKVHYLGASNFEAWRLMKAVALSERNGWARFAFIQNNYSLLERGQEREVLPLCEDQGLGFTPFSPLAGGWLAGRYRKLKDYPRDSRMTMRPEPYRHLEEQSIFDALNGFEADAKKRGVEMATLAMAWVLSHPQTTAIVTGPRRPEHLNLANNALTMPLDAEERAGLGSLFPQ